MSCHEEYADALQKMDRGCGGVDSVPSCQVLTTLAREKYWIVADEIDEGVNRLSWEQGEENRVLVQKWLMLNTQPWAVVRF